MYRSDNIRQTASHLGCNLGAGALIAMLLVGCGEDVTGPASEVERIDISPDSVSIEVGESVDFSAVVVTTSGDTIQDPDIRWWSTDPDVFTVEDNGVAIGQESGSAFCNVELAGRLAAFTGRDSAFVAVF